jgi:two-component system, chemotaxis family, response regulator Rcp1
LFYYSRKGVEGMPAYGLSGLGWCLGDQVISAVPGAAQMELWDCAIPAPEPLDIWAIEDNAPDIVLLHLAMRQLSCAYNLIHIADGEAALSNIAKVESGAILKPPDLIFLDLNLPKIDGLSVLRVVRQSPPFREVPIAILTSSTVQADRKTTAELGADLYVQKVADLDRFLNSVSAAVLDLRPRAHKASSS